MDSIGKQIAYLHLSRIIFARDYYRRFIIVTFDNKKINICREKLSDFKQGNSLIASINIAALAARRQSAARIRSDQARLNIATNTRRGRALQDKPWLYNNGISTVQPTNCKSSLDFIAYDFPRKILNNSIFFRINKGAVTSVNKCGYHPPIWIIAKQRSISCINIPASRKGNNPIFRRSRAISRDFHLKGNHLPQGHVTWSKRFNPDITMSLRVIEPSMRDRRITIAAASNQPGTSRKRNWRNVQLGISSRKINSVTSTAIRKRCHRHLIIRRSLDAV